MENSGMIWNPNQSKGKKPATMVLQSLIPEGCRGSTHPARMTFLPLSASRRFPQKDLSLSDMNRFLPDEELRSGRYHPENIWSNEKS
jgi:hypothetical protein